jgi:hypothetical protein
MKNNISGGQDHSRIPWNAIVQIILALIVFYILGRLVNSLSFAGVNKIETPAPVSALEIFDNFDFKVFDVKWNESTWAEAGTGSQMQQLDGVMTISRAAAGSGGLAAYRRKWSLSQINYVESRLKLSGELKTQAGEIGFEIYTIAGNQWFARCGIHGGQAEAQASILCETADKFSTTPVAAAYDTWHVVRFEVDPEKAALTFFVDGTEVGIYTPQQAGGLKAAEYSLMLAGSSSDSGVLAGSFDYVQLKNR